jgi:hypothetical protein
MDSSKIVTALTGFIQKMTSTQLSRFEELACGTHLYDALGKVAPIFFTDASTKLQTDGLDTNWVLRKANLLALASDMTTFARNALSATEDFDMLRLVDVTSAAKVQPSGDSNSNADAQVDADLRTLAELVFAMCVLSGNQDAIGMIRSLPKDDQTVLNQAAKRVMGLYGLKPAKKGATAAPNSSTATPTVASPTSGRLPSVSSAMDASAMGSADVTVLHQQVQQLRGELRDRQAQIHELEARMELAERERKESLERYRALLESTEEERGAAQSEKAWTQQLSKKDESIRELSTALQDMTAKNASLKKQLENLEDSLEAERKTAQNAMQALKQRTDEKQEAQTQLEILRDRYEVTMSGKKDQNEEIGTLRNEVEMLRAKAAMWSASGNDNSSDVTRTERRQGEFDETVEDENSDLKEKLNAALLELRMLRQSVSSGATPARKATSAARMDDDDGASPEAVRTLLSSADQVTSLDATVSDGPVNVAHGGVAKEEYARIADELAAAHGALGLRDKRIHDLEKKTSSLESHLQRSLQELEDVKASLRPAVVSNEDAAALLEAKKETDYLRKQNGELLHRLTDRSEATRKEQAVLVSTVVQYGHKNLLLQQRQLLCGGGGGAIAASESSTKGAMGMGSMASSVMQGWFMDTPAKDATEISGSFLTKHRRTVERGLLDRFLVSSSSSSSGHRLHK